MKSFKYLDNLIHSRKNNIKLDFDIVLGEFEENEYPDGIKLDFENAIIDGNGHAIDACGKTRIFCAYGENITLKNITLKNGHATEGGAILNRGNLTIKESALIKNTAEDGGAIYNGRGHDLTIIGSTLDENMAKAHGGAISNNHSRLTIKESTICKNEAKYGGAIFHSFNYSLTQVRRGLNEIALRRSPELHKRAERNAQWTEKRLMEKELKNCKLIIEESIIKDNTAGYGGAIWKNNEKTLELKGCNFINNTPDDVY